MNRIDRLFGLVTLLQARRYTPAEHISTHFGISVRTVYRDIRALVRAGERVLCVAPPPCAAVRSGP